MDLEISSQMHPNAEFQMHPNAEFQMHPNAIEDVKILNFISRSAVSELNSKCIQMQNSKCIQMQNSKCIQMQIPNASKWIIDPLKTKKDPLTCWTLAGMYLFPSLIFIKSKIMTIGYGFKWCMLWCYDADVGAERDIRFQRISFSTDLWGLLRQWCWLNTIGPNGERPIVPTMLTQHYWSKWRETYCSNDVEQLMHLLVIWALCTNGIDHLKGQLLFVTKHFKTLGQCLLTNTLFFWPDMWAQ